MNAPDCWRIAECHQRLSPDHSMSILLQGSVDSCKQPQELIRRWDSERELFYDHIVQYFKI